MTTLLPPPTLKHEVEFSVVLYDGCSILQTRGNHSKNRQDTESTTKYGIVSMLL